MCTDNNNSNSNSNKNNDENNDNSNNDKVSSVFSPTISIGLIYDYFQDQNLYLY